MSRSRLNLGLLIGAGTALCGLILMTGPEPLEASLPDSNPQVVVETLERRHTDREVSAIGVLKPRRSLQLTSRVPGEVVWVSEQLTAGGEVAQGDVLFRIDAHDYEIAVASAEAGVDQAQARLDLELGHAENARREWAQWQDAGGAGAKPRPLALREPQQAEALANRKAAQAELERARLAHSRTTIKAPWQAAVVQAGAVVGQVVAVGENIATLLPMDSGIVELQMPAASLTLLDAGINRVELRPVQDPDAKPVLGEFEGVVRSLTEDTRLATARIRLLQPLSLPGWSYGMHLKARIVAKAQHEIVLIPSDLIVSGNLVWVHRAGRAVRHQISPLDTSDRDILVEDNFVSGDQLIIERPIGLFDGAQVIAADL